MNELLAVLVVGTPLVAALACLFLDPRSGGRLAGAAVAVSGGWPACSSPQLP